MNHHSDDLPTKVRDMMQEMIQHAFPDLQPMKSTAIFSDSKVPALYFPWTPQGPATLRFFAPKNPCSLYVCYSWNDTDVSCTGALNWSYVPLVSQGGKLKLHTEQWDYLKKTFQTFSDELLFFKLQEKYGLTETKE